VPKLASGEWFGACATEPGAGSDANSGKTKAVLSEDGKTYSIRSKCGFRMQDSVAYSLFFCTYLIKHQLVLS
jgi:hypothetical protein